jgi:uncharacterized membrane protein HdeD (DUF308 family)
MSKEIAAQTPPPDAAVPWWLILLQGIFAIVLGLLLLSSPGMTTLVLIQFIGLYWLIAGVFNLVGIFLDHSMWGWKLFTGILGVLAGLLVIQHPLWSTVLIPTTLIVVLGIVGLVFGIVSLIAAFRGGGWSAGILGVLAILIGLALLGSPLLGAVTLPFVIGFVALIGGIAAIVQAFRMRK